MKFKNMFSEDVYQELRDFIADEMDNVTHYHINKKELVVRTDSYITTFFIGDAVPVVLMEITTKEDKYICDYKFYKTMSGLKKGILSRRHFMEQGETV